jgi:hypothetical protein
LVLGVSSGAGRGRYRIWWALNARRCPFSNGFRRGFSLGPSVVIKICSALRSRYPGGDDSAAIPSAVASFIFSVSKRSPYAEKRRESALSFRKLLDRWQMAFHSYGLLGNRDTISSQKLLKVSGFLRLR